MENYDIIFIDSPETCERVQRMLFKYGFKWSGCTPKVINKGASILYIQGKRIFYSSGHYWDANKDIRHIFIGKHLTDKDVSYFPDAIKPVPEYTMTELIAKLGHEFKIKK